MTQIYEAHWRDAKSKWDADRWPNFSVKEIAQRSSGWEKERTPVLIIPDFVDKIQELRELIGKPLKISSWYRGPVYNNTISSTGTNGPHTTGRAVDIACHGDLAYNVLRLAYLVGFTGIGVKQKGNISGRFIHLDDLAENETKGPRPWIWSY